MIPRSGSAYLRPDHPLCWVVLSVREPDPRREYIALTVLNRDGKVHEAIQATAPGPNHVPLTWVGEGP